MTPRFAVTWDYRCPFARIGHQHVLAGLRHGADWDVAYVPFSLGQAHVEEGRPDVWDDPEKETGLLALQVGVVVRDAFPDQFPAVHLGLFDARHVDSADLRDRAVLRGVLEASGLDSADVFAQIEGGGPLDTIRREHGAAVADHTVWGVPTFIQGDRAVFVRLMHGPVDDADGHATVDRILDLLAWTDLNEFKATAIPR